MSDDLIKATIKALPDRDLKKATCEPISLGGSDRNYHRIKLNNDQSLIVMKYTSERPDNTKFASATRTLKRLGAATPEILSHDSTKQLFWIEDLGNEHLWDHRDAKWDNRSALYKSVIDESGKLHGENEQSLNKEELKQLEPPFDENLYKWEQDYFFDHFLSYYSRRAPSYQNSLREEEEFKLLIETLASPERVLIHRDLQSQNILLKKNKPHFIDHQGLRLGLREYDIASLLYDPYVSFTKKQRTELIDYTFKGQERSEWEPIFIGCAIQRLMQALGAYSRLGNQLGKTDFLKYIPQALDNLREILSKENILPRLEPYLSDEALEF